MESWFISPPHLAALGMAFTDVAFLHWPYPPNQVEPLLPPDVSPDTFAGTAYVGLVAFRMRCYGEFLAFNVRTYSVDSHGRRGVVFLTMEADRHAWVLAARGARLPYRWARMSLARDVHEIDYRSTRRWPGPIGTGTHIRLRVGPPIPGNTLDHFLTARWRLHHRVNTTTLTAQLAHNPWPLHTAELLGWRQPPCSHRTGRAHRITCQRSLLPRRSRPHRPTARELGLTPDRGPATPVCRATDRRPPP